MSFQIEGQVRIVSNSCTASEMGIEAARQLLRLVVDPMRDQNVSKGAMLDLLLGMLAGTVGHFAQDLSVEEILAQLDNCKRMASDVLGAKCEAHVHPAGKAVH
ncbi:hypothetical protein KW843_07590 [Acidovorax sp. sif1233]|uniref:hypothetical protein n=1 Tax=Acidovorax sp. sif1233 TaxID=2854792 RepID=UPI001C472A61|nr:hypothetical protein [Acidovorax sp. sif1233]MBV7454329.1 hypothetical protein [Acidovorax sp. sif1233]